MNIFGFKIEKIKKERIVELKEHDNYIEVLTYGEGWGTFEAIDAGTAITDILKKLPEKLNINEKVDICKLFIPNITFKITGNNEINN